MWARSQIDELTDDLTNKPGDPNLKQQITDLALNFKLVSQFTSFVAVEERNETSPNGGPPRTVVVPVPLPDSWDYNKVFGAQSEDDRVSRSHGYDGYAPPPSPKSAPNQSYGSVGGVVAGNGGVRGGKFEDKKSVSSSQPPPPPSDMKSKARADLAKDSIDEVRRDSDGPVSKEALSQSRMNATAQFLVRQQSVAGTWGESERTTDLDTTSMALLGYVASGQTDRAGFYQSQVQRGLTSLLSRIDSDGSIKGSQNSIKSQSLALWVFSETANSTSSERYRSAADRLAKSLASTITSGGIISANDAVWASFALASAQKAGLTVNGSVLAQFANTGGSSQIQRSLIAMLAGQRLSTQQRNQTTKELSALPLSLSDQFSVENAIVALFTARLLDSQTAADLQARMFNSLASVQSGSGKQMGGFTLSDNKPIADSARIYLLLGVANGHWSAIK